MPFPIFKLKPEEISVIWGVLNQYPAVLAQRYSLQFKIFGISVHPSVGVRGLITDLIGAPTV